MARRIARAVAFSLVGSVQAAWLDFQNDFGARGDNSTDDTGALKNAFSKLKEGGHTLYFPPGLYLISKVKMENANDATLQFENGAEFQMKVSEHDLDGDWKADKHGRHGGSYGWIHFENCKGLTINGGVFHAAGHWWWHVFKAELSKGGNSCPYSMTWSHSDDLTVNDVYIDMAPALNMKVSGSNRVRMNRIKLMTKPLSSHNTDGLLLADVSDACIDDIYIENGDDCLKVLDTVSDVTFSNGYCMGGHGMTIGGGGSKLKIQNVRWINMNMVSTSDGARFKFTPDTEGYVKNIVYQGFNLVDVGNPINIMSGYHGGTRTKENFEIGDITVTDFYASYNGGLFHSNGFKCDPKAQCNKIHLNNANIDVHKKKDSSSPTWQCENCGGTQNGISPSGLSGFSQGSGGDFDATLNCPAGWAPSPGPSPTPWAPTWQPGQISPLADTGFCLDLVGGDTTNGNLIWLWECNGQENQAWAFPTDSWHIVYQWDQSKCIDAGGGRGGQLQIWDCNGLPQQTWGYDSDMATVYLGDGNEDASCMDLQGGDIRNGSPIWLWECNGQWQQQWYVPSDAVVFVLYNTDLCLDLPGEDTTNGNLLWAWECNGHDSQKWLFTEGTWMIRYAGDTSKCVDGAFMGEGSQLQIWDCNDLSQQKWGYDFDEGHVYLSDSATDASLCMDLQDNNVNNGSPVMVYGCSDFPQQNWVVESADWYSQAANGAKRAKGAKETKHEQSLMVI